MLKITNANANPIYQFINPLLEFDVTSNTPFVPDYLLYCDGSKVMAEETENLYIYNFYNNLAVNPNLGSSFAVNINEMSFILPDLRNRVLRSSGSLLEPYKTQEDAIQNITGGAFGGGSYDLTSNITAGESTVGAIHGIVEESLAPGKLSETGLPTGGACFDFDASRVVRTADEVRVKSYGVFTCIDLRSI